MERNLVCALVALFCARVASWPYDLEQVGYNLNENVLAADPAEYWGEWPDHEYFPSPENWRFPFYTLFLDRFVNGDPTNDNINLTTYERDINSNQMRHGGDAAGLVDTLDYLQGMGIKGIYLAGTILINQPWGADGYSVLDTTLLDRHFGDIKTWRWAITEIHKRGMYVLMDNTLATLGDLLGFKGYFNSTAPFDPKEHKVQWVSDRRYVDFEPGNEYNESCQYPRFWYENGYETGPEVSSQLQGCYDSEFDQYGDVEAFGVFPDWQRQLAKFASVQDRLREWVPSVRQKLTRHSCMLIAHLDIDGFRYDKATQATVDALGDMSAAYRECAKGFGKHNFFLPGEITGGNGLGAVYIGRGREPDMYPKSLEEAVRMTNTSAEKHSIRDQTKGALDGGAFHYSIYRSLTRFLGLDGNLEAGFDTPVNWVGSWYQMLLSNDFVNANTGKFDPRHMFGTTNQDVFRWPTITKGVERMLLGLYITTLHLPGIPLLYWGEEQALYVLDNTAKNYMFGRQAMSSATAWQTHGCYVKGSSHFEDWPIESGKTGCHDDSVSLDHRDPAHPVRNILKTMYQMRENYPALNDGWFIQQLSNMTRDVYHRASKGIPTEVGMWSVLRGRFPDVQELPGEDTPIWLVYQNENQTTNYNFNCADKDTALISVFGSGTTVKNLFYPFDELTLKDGPVRLGIEGSGDLNGCVDSLELKPWDFKAFVPKQKFMAPRPSITKFTPGHDARLLSSVRPDQKESVPVELYFSAEMNCASLTGNIEFNSTTATGKTPLIDNGSVKCEAVEPDEPQYIGQVPSVWRWSANLNNVYNGVHRLTVRNAFSEGDKGTTNAVDHFLFRIGQNDNPIVFTRAANYSENLLHKDTNGNLYVSHHATGADLYRYSLNWASSWSNWISYKGGNDTLSRQPWSGTKLQQWEGEHVILEYWNRMTGSSSHIQHGDYDWNVNKPRRYPHLFLNGPYNQYGYDAGTRNQLELGSNGTWTFNFMAEWPAQAHVNVWGLNPDGKPDQTYIMGDTNEDSVLDRLPPSSQQEPVINITDHPPHPYLSWTFTLNDGTLRYELTPAGSMYYQLVLFLILMLLPVLSAAIATHVFRKSFYQVKINEQGTADGDFYYFDFWRKRNTWGIGQYISSVVARVKGVDQESGHKSPSLSPISLLSRKHSNGSIPSDSTNTSDLRIHDIRETRDQRRTVLLATLEYEIPDYSIRIKIGGLGVIAQLMTTALPHHDLIWVVPCVGGVEYPMGRPTESMYVTICEAVYEVKVRYLYSDNITYLMLDAPVFRSQTREEPYPPRMDDLRSAVYYSTWNQCIALASDRFKVDLYHINDYHGALAPLYLLPRTIPVCLSLHNAEFQGLWPMRTEVERSEICAVFDIERGIAKKYAQFGEVFNLLHAGASYLRIHQDGFGAVGVSKKYGKRSFARYPIFWGLKNIGHLPNPDPADKSPCEGQVESSEDLSIEVDRDYENSRVELRREAQKWAGLKEDASADLFVFVGRWSLQKGVDLIADVFAEVLGPHGNAQLICVGPVIDLHGRFAAMKLSRLMELYPDRVFSKPEFTNLPPCIFSGAEFALIPSRDEPFGLVAVEFGRKGALGVGARVGGLGRMPGWWYTVESVSTPHLLQQFRFAIESALASPTDMRAKMRARSAKQRFPVIQWVEELNALYEDSIDAHLGLGPSHSEHVLEANVEPVKTVLATFSSSQSFNPDLSFTSRTTLAPSYSPDGIDSRGFNLQKLDPLFLDATGRYAKDYEQRLGRLTPGNSESQLCIDDYLLKSKKKWFGQFRNIQLKHKLQPNFMTRFSRRPSIWQTPVAIDSESSDSVSSIGEEKDEFHTGEGYTAPRGLRRWMQLRIGDWPVYSFLLAFGQIISANSYQITLLTGEIGQTTTNLYTIASIYAVTSAMWWLLYRKTVSTVPLSLAFFLYGLGFCFVGIAQVIPLEDRGFVQRIGTGIYAAAASSGSIFFSLNFGDECGAKVKDWVLRASLIQGTQKLYVVGLWYWGATLSKRVNSGDVVRTVASDMRTILTICVPITMLMWGIGLMLYFGLPNYYRQKPGKIDAFYRSFSHRKVVIWFFITVIIQNFFLSAPYGRNWTFLWTSQHAKPWQVTILVLFFFGFIWASMLALMTALSEEHSWILPIFSIGLGAPRWAQIWWATSNIGLYLPWTKSYVVGALVSRGLWLWLGVLDAMQNVGFGMILLQTLTRQHMCFTLLISQSIGSIATMCARAFAPNRLGPGPVHPDISSGLDTLGTPWFWVTLVLQILICVGFFLCFRKGQLSKP